MKAPTQRNDRSGEVFDGGSGSGSGGGGEGSTQGMKISPLGNLKRILIQRLDATKASTQRNDRSGRYDDVFDGWSGGGSGGGSGGPNKRLKIIS